MTTHAVAYVSTAVRCPVPTATLDRVLAEARQFNADHGVTGVLLYNDGNFLQYFEGPKSGVDAVYERVRAARTHHDLIELLAGPVARTYFASWSMGFALPAESELQRLAHADWERALRDIAPHATESPGLVLLLDFWERTLA